MSNYNLREATPEDAGLLLSLIHAAFAEYVGKLDPPSGALNDTLEKINGSLERGRAVIALVEGVPAGCTFYEQEPGHVYLYRLAVRPGYRRRGIAEALIRYVESIAIEQGLPVRLGVRTAVPANRAYYERLGYRHIEDHYHTGYDEPTWVMLERRWD